MAETRMLTSAELAKILRVAQISIQRLSARGEIPGRKVAGRWRFNLAEVEAHLSRQLKTKASKPPHSILETVEAIQAELRGIRDDIKKLKRGK